MIVLIQRVTHASVKVDSELVSKIDQGLLIFLGVTHEDNDEDIEWLTNKIINLRIFDDKAGIMNISCIEKDANILTVSQFTLHARTKKGNRPSYIEAAKPEIAEDLYDAFVLKLNKLTGKQTKKGVFGANMQIDLCNDGPVTIIIDSKNRR